MILTIKTPNNSWKKMGVFQSEIVYGLDTESNADNTFEIVCFDPKVVDTILRKSNGTVISQR